MSNSAQAMPQDIEAPLLAGARQLYLALQTRELDAATREQARTHLAHWLAQARTLPNELPEALDDAAALERWMLQHVAAVGEQYQHYLSARKQGAPRRYFSNRSHALYFLQAVAPTKLVDGAWLYGLLRRWNDAGLHGLIQTYLEELGDGVPDKNHVALYQHLLATHGCERWQHLDDEHFVQGAIQLCLANEAEHFLPELIGYNLGYEQLPLHLLITAYELNELGIDPYYFTLHVTIDNAAAGHARKAAQSLQQACPVAGDVQDFYRRVADGYRLNELGAGTLSVIASFDLQDELVRILQEKAVVGRHMHSNYCRVAGRNVNDWLAHPDQIPAFLSQLEKAGWIMRGEPAEHSRFWRLVHGERAEMFGVFSEYEQQILRDWIATPAADNAVSEPSARRPALHVVSHRAQRHAYPDASRPAAQSRITHLDTARGVIRRHRDESADFNHELRALEERLAALDSKAAMMQALIPLMSPARHHTPAGLMATRIFRKLFA
ncbi:MAG TPA: iron-containing redox enzyme family protein [Oxalicibacterium sp.]|nr:iron-containing redox enzyme family protein [Oxalicibacterium sp.]